MFDFFRALFRPAPPSGETAKERLKLVLLSDHLSLAPDVVDSLKRDLIDVISRYVEIDTDNSEVTFEHREREIAMLASIPITAVRERPLPQAPPPIVEPIATASVPPVDPFFDVPIVEPEVEPSVAVADGPAAVADIEAPADAVEPVPPRAANGAPPRRRRRKKYANGVKRAAPQDAPPPHAEAAP